MRLEIIYLINTYKKVLALNNPQWLICHKTKTNTIPLLRVECNSRSFLSGVKLVWIKFSFSPIVCQTKAKNSLPYNLPIAPESTDWFMSFSIALVQSEIHTASSRIRTRITDSVSYNDNRYAIHASVCVCVCVCVCDSLKRSCYKLTSSADYKIKKIIDENEGSSFYVCNELKSSAQVQSEVRGQKISYFSTQCRPLEERILVWLGFTAYQPLLVI